MDRKDVIELMKKIYTSSEAAEYLNITPQRLNKLVHDKQLLPVKASKSIMLFYKSDLDKRKVTNITNFNNTQKTKSLDIDNLLARDAILYFTIQQYFNNNDKKTSEFINQITQLLHFDFHSGLKNNIPLLSNQLNVSEKDFYSMYCKVKASFQTLSDDVILLKKGEHPYSKLLENTDEAPPYLFAKGNVNLLNEKSVCVVGSRNASEESMKRTARLVKSLISRNLVVNAGLAKGIDTATHQSALDNYGRTIAVIGTPINQYYPKENKELQMRIEKEGLVLSQFPPCNKVNRWNFPTRNGVMSGLSLATIIMEAGETSGALKQANYALKQSRYVLIPQSAINNTLITWPNKYVKKGAYSFSTLKEVLEILNKNALMENIFNTDDMEAVQDVEMD